MELKLEKIEIKYIVSFGKFMIHIYPNDNGEIMVNLFHRVNNTWSNIRGDVGAYIINDFKKTEEWGMVKTEIRKVLKLEKF
jgi:hypothetical protein